MQCPRCKSDSCRRSRRRGLHEYVYSLAEVYPWRCRDCEHRFYAVLVPLRQLFYAHCPRCGSFNLERISGAAPAARFSFAGRLPLVFRLRCDPCRLNFVSVRPLRAAVAGAASTAEASARTDGKRAL